MDHAKTFRRPTRTLGSVLFLAAVVVSGLLLQGYVGASEMTDRLAATRGWIGVHPGLAAPIFAAVYVAVTGLSLPGATALTLIGGSLFGLWTGTLLVSFASVVGATAGMIVARYFLRDAIKRRLPDVVAKVDRGIEADGARYLFALRLVPVVPFFAVNLAMGLTRMPVRTFAWVSQLGMLPGTLLYVNAGHQLASIENPGDILSPRIVLAFAALAALPFVARAGSAWWGRRNALRAWRRPRRFDYNLLVIGAGSAGLVTAYLAAAARARRPRRGGRDGRRLSEHRVRPVQGADPVGQARERGNASGMSWPQRSPEA